MNTIYFGVRSTDTLTGETCLHGTLHPTRSGAEGDARTSAKADALGPDPQPGRWTYEVVEVEDKPRAVSTDGWSDADLEWSIL